MAGQARDGQTADQPPVFTSPACPFKQGLGQLSPEQVSRWKTSPLFLIWWQQIILDTLAFIPGAIGDQDN